MLVCIISLSALISLLPFFAWTLLLRGLELAAYYPFHRYFSLRGMPGQHMPEIQRTTGLVARMRGIGTVASLFAVVFPVIPFEFLSGFLMTLVAREWTR